MVIDEYYTDVYLQIECFLSLSKCYVQSSQNLINSLISLSDRWLDSYCLSIYECTCSHYVLSEELLSYVVTNFCFWEFHADQHSGSSELSQNCRVLLLQLLQAFEVVVALSL